VNSGLPQASDPSPGNAATIQQTYTIENMSGPFLPALEQPVRVSGKGLAFDELTGTLAATGSDTKGYSYSVESDVPPAALAFDDPRILDTQNASQGVNSSAKAYLQVPSGIPAVLLAFDDQVVPTGTSELSWLDALDKDLQSPRFDYSTTAEPGHSLGRLAAMFATGVAGSQYSRYGTAEQFAAVFALLARMRGYPARVVVGYTIDQPGGAQNGKAISVTAGEITAWDEVDVNGLGWVAFDPIATEQNSVVPPPSVSQPTPSTVVPTTARSGNVKSATPSTFTYHNAPPGSGTFPFWIILPIILILLIALIVLLKVYRRRRRERAGTVAQRVVGAWHETEEYLRATGLRVTSGMTVTEVVAACEVRLTAEVVRRVADFQPILDLALYSPSEPEEPLATQAWDVERDAVRLMKGEVGVKARIRYVADPRSLQNARSRPR
jgi:hypothetical protein